MFNLKKVDADYVKFINKIIEWVVNQEVLENQQDICSWSRFVSTATWTFQGSWWSRRRATWWTSRWTERRPTECPTNTSTAKLGRSSTSRPGRWVSRSTSEWEEGFCANGSTSGRITSSPVAAKRSTWLEWRPILTTGLSARRTIPSLPKSAWRDNP